jgi:hypothetical protein
MKDVEGTLTSQAATLNLMFGELNRRAYMNMGEYLDASERYLRLALKAQNQCRMTLETLSNIKNPPVIYAKQANIANGPQQVNNGAVKAVETQNPPNKLLEQGHDQRVDIPTQGGTGTSNSAVKTVEARNRDEVA